MENGQGHSLDLARQVSRIMEQPNHDHDYIQSRLLNNINVRYIVTATIVIGCEDCVDLVSKRYYITLRMLNVLISSYDDNWTHKRKRGMKKKQECIRRYIKNHNDSVVLPLLVAFSNQMKRNPILYHSLYTRDALRATLRLATIRLPPTKHK
jgi:hypothetical protein